MRNIYLIFCVVVFSVILSACGINSQPIPTVIATPAPTDIPVPTSIFTPEPKVSPAATINPTKATTLEFGDTRIIVAGGYSIREPKKYRIEAGWADFSVKNFEDTFSISLTGFSTGTALYFPEEVAEGILKNIFKEANGEYQKSNPQKISIDGLNGLSFDLTAKLLGENMRGRVIVVKSTTNQFLFGLGLAKDDPNNQIWDGEGSRVFSELIKSIKFLSGWPSSSTRTCIVSTDNTYGYTQENPIRVGGDAMGGPARERGYLDNLLGPNGEKTSYNRLKSIPFDNTILDVYEITGLNKAMTLYLDEYSYTDPKAPVGFTCQTAFVLSQP